MKMYVAGDWIDRPGKIEVSSPFDGTAIDTVPRAEPEDIERALAAAVEGAARMRAMPAYERYLLLRRAAELMVARQDELGHLISREEGKVLSEGLFEASRSATTIEVSSEEAKRLDGEVLPLDGAPGGAGKFGFTWRVPCGVVVAITPFNFPLNLVCHKIGPALAAGNAVILKPASDTPLSALTLVQLLLEAGFPPLAIQCLTGRGDEVGEALCRDPRVRKISFTGSAEVGRAICRVAGAKRVTMELGSNSPLIVLDDADLAKVVEATIVTGYTNAGQTCISTQRLIATAGIHDELIARLKPRVDALRTGDPLDPATRMGPMIRESDARRVEVRVEEAVSQGARIVSGGGRTATRMDATLLADVSPTMGISRDELFGPAVCVSRAGSIDEALAMANDSRYGLSAGIFTRDIDRAFHFAERLETGNIHINWGPQWRADFMPYGGLKESGFGKEGPRYAIEEMTETKMVVIHRGS